MLMGALVVGNISSVLAAPPRTDRKVYVVQIAPARDAQSNEVVRFTHALETKVASLPRVQFLSTNKKLLRLLDEAKCGRGFADRALYEKPPLNAQAGQLIDDTCLEKLSALTDTSPVERYVWGWMYESAPGQSAITVQLWSKDASERRMVTLPYDPAVFEQTAQRVALRLLEAEHVGDIRIVTPTSIKSGSLYVDNAFVGPWDSSHPEVTIAAGQHMLEVHSVQGVWRATATVLAQQRQQIRLAAPAASPQNQTKTASESPSPWPWIFGGAAVAGTVGAGIFAVLGGQANSDVRKLCGTTACASSKQTTLNQAKLYNNTLLPVAAGVGLVGLGGLATWWLLHPRAGKENVATKSSWTGSAVPTQGGVSVSLTRSF